MAIEIGKYISPELREYIHTFVEVKERKQLHCKYDFTFALEQMTLSGVRAITNTTHKYFEELLKLAIHNRTYKMKLLNKVHKEVSNIM